MDDRLGHVIFSRSIINYGLQDNIFDVVSGKPMCSQAIKPQGKYHINFSVAFFVGIGTNAIL